MVREQIRENVFFDKPATGAGFYVKTGEIGHLTGTLEETYQSYLLLRDFFKEPKVRMLNHRDNPLLIIEEAKGKPLAELMNENLENTVSAFDKYSEDLKKMWVKTVEPMDESKVVRNLRYESQATLDLIEGNKRYGEIKDKPLKVNGVEYPPLIDSIKLCRERLKKVESVMVFAHGDEHFENIISQNGNYEMIDPRRSGFLPPSQVINSFQGMNYLLLYKFDSQSNMGSECEINYKPIGGAEPVFRSKFKELNLFLKTLDNGIFLTREYLFTNLLRGMTENIKASNICRLHPDKLLYAGMASQALYGDIV